MPGLLIPDDWDEQSDGYCLVFVTAPNSPLWRASVRGAIQTLTLERVWDGQTGDVAQVVVDAQEIYDSYEYECGIGGVPIWLERGSQVSYQNGVYTLQSEAFQGAQNIKVWVNYDGQTYLSNDTYELTTVSNGFSGGTSQPKLYDQFDNQAGWGYGDLNNHCGSFAFEYNSSQDAPVFTVDLTIGAVCP